MALGWLFGWCEGRSARVRVSRAIDGVDSGGRKTCARRRGDCHIGCTISSSMSGVSMVM